MVLLPVALACGGGSKPASPAPAATTPAKHVDPATVGTVTGKVVFRGVPPKPDTISMSSDPVCAKAHGGTAQVTPVMLGPDNALQNVVVYVKSGLSGYTFEVPSKPVELDQEGCQYQPHIVVLRVGQPLEILNSDPTLHNVHAIPKANEEFNFGEFQGLRSSHTFTEPEVGIPITCDVHRWMSAYAAVFDHPYYAVTGNNGQFSLASLPPGTYQLEAWHEKLGTQSQSVTIAPNETKDVTFAFGTS